MYKHTKPVTVYGYVRVSGASQSEKDGPVRQRKAIKDFCTLHQLGDVKFYQDLGVSGTMDGMNRPAFTDLVLDAITSGVKIVVVEKLDRFARDLIVSEMLMRELRKRGIALYSAEQGMVDMVSAEEDPSRTLIRQIFAAMAQYDKSSLVIKLRAARERKKRVEGKCGGANPYEATPYGRRVLELIIRLREMGSSWAVIADTLTRDKLHKRNGQLSRWTDAEVCRLWKRFKDRREREKEFSQQKETECP